MGRVSGILGTGLFRGVRVRWQTRAVTLRDVRYAGTAGIELAYTVTGDGPMDVVLVPGLFGHLEYNEETPWYRGMVTRLPRVARLIVFDRRGVGLSGGTALGPLEEQMDDIRTVMDAAGSPSAAVIGCGDAGHLRDRVRGDVTRACRSADPVGDRRANVGSRRLSDRESAGIL